MDGRMALVFHFLITWFRHWGSIMEDGLTRWIRYADYLEARELELLAERSAHVNVITVACAVIVALAVWVYRLRRRLRAVSGTLAVQMPAVAPIFLQEPSEQVMREFAFTLARARFWKRAYFDMIDEHRRLVSVNASIEAAFRRMAALGGIYLGGVVEDMPAPTGSEGPEVTRHKSARGREEGERRLMRQITMQHQGLLRLLTHFVATKGLNEDVSQGIVREGDVVFVYCHTTLPRDDTRAEIIRRAREGADCATRFMLYTHQGEVVDIQPLNPGDAEDDVLGWAIRS